MKLVHSFFIVAVLSFCISQAYAVTLTFDNIPDPCPSLSYYSHTYGIGFDSVLGIVDHTGSTWGPPHSGNNVLISSISHPYLCNMSFQDMQTGILKYAYSVGGYFSTQSGVQMQILGFRYGYQDPVASASIGAQGESWNNVYVEINSALGINMVEFVPITTNALLYFCADDINVNFVPEPSSLLAILGGVAGLGGIAWRRRK